MKKSLVFLLVAVIFSFGVNGVFVQTPVFGAEITFQDLGVENPGILPNSPFYFLKNISRGVKRFFTFNPIKRAELELNIVNEQAAEIKKIKEISPENIDAIAKAANNYSENVEKLKTRLEIIKETSKNPNVDKLVENLVDRSIKHQRLFEELKKDFREKEELKSLFDKNQESISEAVAKVPEKFENIEEFNERLKKNIENQMNDEIGELKAAGVVDKFESKLPEEDGDSLESAKSDLKKDFGEIKEKILKKNIERKDIKDKDEDIEKIINDTEDSFNEEDFWKRENELENELEN